MIKNTQGSSSRIVLAVLCSMIVILLVLYIRQTNQYSTLLRLHHRAQITLQDKSAETIRMANELKLKDSQCTTEVESLDKEVLDCETNSKTISKEILDLKKTKDELESKTNEHEASLTAEKEKYSEMENKLKFEAEQCAAEETNLRKQLNECQLSKKSTEKGKEVEMNKSKSIFEASQNLTVNLNPDDISENEKLDKLDVEKDLGNI